jgi:hypothetical protein
MSWCLGVTAALIDVQTMQSRGSPWRVGRDLRGAGAYLPALPSPTKLVVFLQGGKLGFIGMQALEKVDKAPGPECDPGESNMERGRARPVVI